MNKKNLRGILLLLITATVWGVAFVAQSVGMEHLNAFAFNSIRNLIGVVVLLPFMIYRNHTAKQKQPSTMPLSNNDSSSEKQPPKNNSFLSRHKDLMLGGLVCGTALCIASNLQQMGIEHSTVGKSAFITTLYIVLVPILGIFLKKKVPLKTWLGVILAMIGFYLLCMKNEAFVLGIGDIYLLLCALFFSFQILLVDYFVQKVDGVALSALQFFVCGILSGIGMLFTEIPSFSDVAASAIPLLYAGAISCGIGYTLQIIGQKDVPASIASLIMSLESVIAALAGWVLLHEVLSQKEFIGCGLVFVAVILTQLPNRKELSK